MESALPQIDSNLIVALKEKYFCNKAHTKQLKAGEFIMHQNKENYRLYLVLDGLVAGYLQSGEGQRQEIFRSGIDMFVGVHSFFSKSFSAYADVQAIEDTTLAYIEADKASECYPKMVMEDFVPVIVHELSARQVFTKNLMHEKEMAQKRLHQSDKMATLGQLAAGLAHELNNAIGVMNGNSEWVAKELHEIFKQVKQPEIFSQFDSGYSNGQYLSSQQVRQRKKALEKQFNFSRETIKFLARLDMDEKAIKQLSLSPEFEMVVGKMHQYREMGVAIHDILLASRHAVHVLNSIKQLSAANQHRRETDINETIKEALTLLKNKLLKVDVNVSPGELNTIVANSGELVQVWVNIIKNACESMLETNAPQINISTGRKGANAVVRIGNNGPQIPRDVQDKIFQPSFSTKVGGMEFGLGLGLSIVQRLVDGYGGKIKVESTAKETTFEIIIPL
jgi:signal transduction histidine kinase